jgi:antitoxin (DNA-binding transcriptional repressor) of toxin-antitoxin stability system
MRSAQVSELKERLDEVIEAVRNGETVEIREGESAIAQMRPSKPSSAKETDPDPLPDWFFEERPPKFEGGGVLDQFLRDRKESPW